MEAKIDFVFATGRLQVVFNGSKRSVENTIGTDHSFQEDDMVSVFEVGGKIYLSDDPSAPAQEFKGRKQARPSFGGTEMIECRPSHTPSSSIDTPSFWEKRKETAPGEWGEWEYLGPMYGDGCVRPEWYGYEIV